MTDTLLPPYLRENVPLAPFTTFGIGGPARFFAEARNEDHLLDALAFAGRRGCPIFVLGGGSNLLVADSGFDGLVLHIALSGIHPQGDAASDVITVSAGEKWDDFVRGCIEGNLAGVECLSGIPGTVGGTPIQNVGAYGEEVSDTIVSVRVLERKTGRVEEVSNAQCAFAYRTSIFNTARREQYIVLAVTYALRAGGAPRITHADVQKRFSGKAGRPSLRETREAILAIRDSKGMLVSSGDPDCRSAGSFFRNPIVSAETASRIEDMARRSGRLTAEEVMPRFKVDADSVKLPAAWIMERSGYCRGFACGPVALSSKHTLAVVNRGGATARDVVRFMREIQEAVRATFEIEILPEPVFVGF